MRILSSIRPRGAPRAAIGNAESDAIRIARVLCITFMMGVHVNPGVNAPSVVTNSVVGLIWLDFLGLASVAALSFFSGYIILAQGTFFGYLKRRALRILLPGLIWNVVYILLRFVHEGPPDASAAQFIFADLLGVTGPTANLSLFFLRDLFVSGVIIFLLSDWIVRYPVLAFAIAAVFTFFINPAPIVFRPPILLFMVAGHIARRWSLSELGRARVALPIVALSVGVWVATYATVPESGASLLDVAKRAGLTAATLLLVSQLAHARTVAAFRSLERIAFPVYLTHVTIISVAWVAWKLLVGHEHHWSYWLFFIGAPVLSFLAVALMERVSRSWPALRLWTGLPAARTPPRAQG